MFEKILYPTDFSDVSKRALDFIKQLKGAGTKEVIVFHVIDIRWVGFQEAMSGGWANIGFEDFREKHQEHVQKEMRAVEDELKKSGFAVKTRIDRGIPFREILKAEQEEDISAIVIGSHGISSVEEMLLGSVSENVIRACIKPVLVVKG